MAMISKSILFSLTICLFIVSCATQNKQVKPAAVSANPSERVPNSETDFVKMNDLVNNVRATQEKVEGIRNFRVVMPKVLYRGGGPGGNTTLNETSFKSLSERHFSEAVYMYDTAWNTRPKNTFGVEYSLYSHGDKNISFKTDKYKYDFLAKVKDVIVNGKGPIFVHCWNGWHASGEMATLALMQFCGLKADPNEKCDPRELQTSLNVPITAQNYWNRNVGSLHCQIKRMQSFKPFPDLMITEEQAAHVCPK